MSRLIPTDPPVTPLPILTLRPTPPARVTVIPLLNGINALISLIPIQPGLIVSPLHPINPLTAHLHLLTIQTLTLTITDPPAGHLPHTIHRTGLLPVPAADPPPLTGRLLEQVR